MWGLGKSQAWKLIKHLAVAVNILEIRRAASLLPTAVVHDEHLELIFVENVAKGSSNQARTWAVVMEKCVEER